MGRKPKSKEETRARKAQNQRDLRARNRNTDPHTEVIDPNTHEEVVNWDTPEDLPLAESSSSATVRTLIAPRLAPFPVRRPATRSQSRELEQYSHAPIPSPSSPIPEINPIFYRDQPSGDGADPTLQRSVTIISSDSEDYESSINEPGSSYTTELRTQPNDLEALENSLQELNIRKTPDTVPSRQQQETGLPPESTTNSDTAYTYNSPSLTPLDHPSRPTLDHRRPSLNPEGPEPGSAAHEPLPEAHNIPPELQTPLLVNVLPYDNSATASDSDISIDDPAAESVSGPTELEGIHRMNDAHDFWCYCENNYSDPSGIPIIEPDGSTNREAFTSFSTIGQRWQASFDHYASETAGSRPLASEGTFLRQASNNYGYNIQWNDLLSDQYKGSSLPPLSTRLIQEEAARIILSRFPTGPFLQTEHDVDSHFFSLRTLAAHKGGFELSYYPKFNQRITQNPRIKFGGILIHKHKQLRLGKGTLASGCGFQCHIIFPEMPVTKTHEVDRVEKTWDLETHLSNYELGHFIDDMVLPALRESYSDGVLQHHPRNFEEVLTKARIKKETVLKEDSNALEPRYHLPEHGLGTFWGALQRRCNEFEERQVDTTRIRRYRNPLLIVSGHDLKLHTKSMDQRITRQLYFDLLDRGFYTDDDHVVRDDWWLDEGWEHFPTSSDGISFIFKACCVDAWAEAWKPNTGNTTIKKQTFHFAGLKALGSISVELGQHNGFRKSQSCRFAYGKAYNSIKDQFTTQMKNNHPFEHPALTQLALDQTILDQKAANNGLLTASGQAGNLKVQRTALVAILKLTKQRLRAALRATVDTNFGIRGEMRKHVDSYLTAEFLPPGDKYDLRPILEQLAKGEHDAAQHLSFVIIPTDLINRFQQDQIDRWLLPIEYFDDQARPRSTLKAVEVEQQRQNNLSLQIALKILRAITCSDLMTTLHCSPLLWRGNTKCYHYKNVADREECTRKHKGLNLENAWKTTGILCLPHQIMRWNIPALTDSHARILRPRALDPRGKPWRTVMLDATARKEDRTRRHMRNLIVNAGSDWQTNDAITSIQHAKEGQVDRVKVLETLAQLLVQAYIRDVVDQVLLKRALEEEGAGTGHRQRMLLREQLRPDFVNGLEAMTVTQLRPLCNEPYIICVRAMPRHGVSKFDNDGTWTKRLYHLFDVQPRGQGKAPAWDNYHFRRRTRDIMNLIREEIGPDVEDAFAQHTLPRVAAQFIWIAPAYEMDKFAPLEKPSKHNSDMTRQAIGDRSTLERTKWMAPTWGDWVSAVMRLRASEVHRDWDNKRCPMLPPKLAKQLYQMYSMPLKARDTEPKGGPYTEPWWPSVVKLGGKLVLAKAFQEQVEDSDEGSVDNESTDDTDEIDE